MKILLIFVSASILILGCNRSTTNSGSGLNPELKLLYEKNLATLMAANGAFEREQLDEWASFVADTAVWNPAGYGSLPGKKEDWYKALASIAADWDSLKLMNANYLPGVDQITKEFDGSVRYYGLWVGYHKSGLETSVHYYATANFNNQNKITVYSEYYDVGGLVNAIAAPK